ncbi:DEAD/DEAH box helicase [Sphingobacterium corticis]|uniref:DEAD/DEAH box helicase n=1 Tax=Sphingobacterium corticis TaxID=1812823 RepID=A0ABW5NHM8_9SPHI
MQQVDSALPFRLIYSLGEHPYLGYLIEPHVVQLNGNGSLSLTYKRVFSNTVEEYASSLSTDDLEIIGLLDEIEQTNIIKRYHKKAIRPADYFSLHFDQKIFQFIRPKIEQRLLKVLAKLADKPLYLMSKKDGYPAEKQINMATEPASVLFHFRRNETETRYFPTLKYCGHRMEFMFKDAEVIVQEQAWLLLEGTLYHFDQPLDGKKLSPFLNKRYISVPRSTEKKYFETFVGNLIERHHVYAEGFEIKTLKEEATPILTIRGAEDQQPQIELSFQYGEYHFPPSVERPVTVHLQHDEAADAYTFTRIKRSVKWEQKQEAILAELGLQTKDRLFGSFDVAPPSNSRHAVSTLEWISTHIEQLKELGFKIEQQTGSKKFYMGRASLDLSVEEQNDWFDLKAFVTFGSYKIPFIQLRDHILNRVQEFKLPNGEIAIIPEAWFAQYEHLFHFSTDKDGLKLSRMHVGILQEISEHTIVSFQRKLEKLHSFEEIEQVPPPEQFKGQLRPYQQAGYNWFQFLQQYRFGGILADDMGLGKTVQTIALLQRQKENRQTGESAIPSLLILPTSLLYNWQKEAARFAPKLRVLIHTGYARTKDSFAFSHFDLIITTYGIARSDEGLFSKFFFDYIILDESQHIKNPSSKSFKAIKNFKSKHRLALSGTPIENSVADLWTQMHFTNPGLLGSYRYFQEEFVIPIEKKKDEDRAQRLQAMIKPFVLRRTKNQVATELPSKTEQIIYCPMNDKQLKLYDKTKSAYRNVLLDGPAPGEHNQLTLLQGLMKLRQLANHPQMVEEDYADGSGKFDTVLEMLESVHAEDSKILIFSQFVKHLDIFRQHFDKRNVKYAYLDGGTKDREAAVNQFKNDSSTRIFLISIKAGGVGLNLTEADYVFILDPWWNPAVEQQAIDRSHRIGQKRNVFIYRFISKDSVEEKIVALQNRKKKLSSALITTEESFVKSLTQEDLSVLLM